MVGVVSTCEFDDFIAYAVGLVSASVCTSLPIDEATERLNREYPTGLSHGWQPSTDEAFATGEPQPGPCEQSADRKHCLFHC